MLRFGLPTMPAELTLYSLNFIDRILIVRLAGLAEAGLYALAIKFAQGINVLARGFQLAFPPLAYSISDDDEARRAYALIFTWFAAVCAFATAGLWLLSRQITELLAAPEFFEAHEAIGLLATGVSLYALYLVMVVILGRTGRTERSFPATVAGMIVNVALNLALIPPLGIVGAGLALAGSYVVVVVLMYALTRRLFPVPYEWGRLSPARRGDGVPRLLGRGPAAGGRDRGLGQPHRGVAADPPGPGGARVPDPGGAAQRAFDAQRPCGARADARARFSGGRDGAGRPAPAAGGLRAGASRRGPDLSR